MIITNSIHFSRFLQVNSSLHVSHQIFAYLLQTQITN